MEGSITRLLGPVREGDQAATHQLCERYFATLVQLAEQHLRGVPAGDGEDAALSALASFFVGAAAGRFPDLKDRHGLARLLCHITTMKALRHRRNEHRLKRGGAYRRAEGDECLLEQLVDERQVPPSLAVEMAEECRRLLGCLEDDALREVAVLTLEGHTIDEIAERLGCSRRSIDRKRQRIRTIWRQELER